MTGERDAFDVIVVGGGPAGAAAAFTVARSGLAVCLIDRAEFPRDKLCAGGLTERCRMRFESVFGQALPGGMVGSSEWIVFLMAGQALARMEGRVHLTMRRVFDAHMAGLAQAAGAVAVLGDGVEAVDPAARSVRLKSGRVLRFGHLVGADGVSSVVARQLFGAAFDPGDIGFGLEVEVPRADLPAQSDDVEIDFGAAAWGYGWVFPKRESFTIGVFGVHRRNADLRGRLNAYLAARGLEPARYKVKGQYLPFGERRPAPGRGRILLCGDAAGFVDPISGEGIGYAIESGAAAGAAIAQAVAAGRPDAAFGLYLKAVAAIRRSMRQARGWRVPIYAGWTRRLFARGFRRAQIMRQGYLEIVAGSKDYDDLWGMMARQVAGTVMRRLGRQG